MPLKTRDWITALSPLIVLVTLTGILIHYGDEAVTRQRQASWPEHYRIASSKTILGKGVKDACLDYAINLRTELCIGANLFPEMLIFNWWDEETGMKGTHAIVYYMDRNGQMWVVDNQSKNPIAVHDIAKNEDLVRPLVKDNLRLEALPTLVQSSVNFSK